MTTPTDALWNALTARIESDGGVMHRSSFDEVVVAFVPEPAPTPVAPIASAGSLLAKVKALHAPARGEVSETPPSAGVFKVGDCVTIPRGKLNDAVRCAFARHGRWTFDKCVDDKAVFRRIA